MRKERFILNNVISRDQNYRVVDEMYFCCGEMMFRYYCEKCDEFMGCYFCEFDYTEAHECD